MQTNALAELLYQHADALMGCPHRSDELIESSSLREGNKVGADKVHHIRGRGNKILVALLKFCNVSKNQRLDTFNVSDCGQHTRPEL